MTKTRPDSKNTSICRIHASINGRGKHAVEVGEAVKPVQAAYQLDVTEMFV